MIKQKLSPAITLEETKKKNNKELNSPSLLVSICKGLSMTQWHALR